MGGTSFVFGTVTSAHNANAISGLRLHLNKTPSLAWIRDAVDELPDYWDILAQKIPSVPDSVPRRQTLLDFGRWLRHGFNEDEESVVLGNIVLIPLVIIVGLIEFQQHVEFTEANDSEDPLKEFLAHLRGDSNSKASDCGSIGLCAGMLTAYAVASSHSSPEFERYGAAAIRLAMMVGACTDVQDSWHGHAKSYVAVWRTSEQGDMMRRAVELVYPQAYVSVLYDERRATITTTAEWVRSSLLRQLRGAGLTVAESGIQGHIHCPNTESKSLSDAICELCTTNPALQLGDISTLALETYTNDGHADPVTDKPLHEIAVRSSLATTCRWYDTFVALPLANRGHTQRVVSFGPERCIPPSLVPLLGERWTHIDSDFASAGEAAVSDVCTTVAPHRPAGSQEEPDAEPLAQFKRDKKPPKPKQQSQPGGSSNSDLPEDTIAVVGMSIKTAGADDVDEFSRMIKSGLSQHGLVTPERVNFHTLWREADWASQKWYANFMQGVDHFDHQFFKKSSREAATMDPQQRLALQAAYQAVESAGYYVPDEVPARHDERSRVQDLDRKQIGVYVGVTVEDYQNHVRTHEANAFTILGNMRSLIAGRIAHHFGWTGPAMTVDTACSSSAVAIHNAMRDLLAGDCYAALAGGSNVITEPLVFQDLAAAGFLSPTGQCKPFDEGADGYCRGEAVGFVFLKRLSDAVADGNQILGCIASSAAHQNENHTPIFVPNAPSLTGLFQKVIKKAQIPPSEIDFVECHGTGTPVGDPAEWEGVRQALVGEDQREGPVYVGSAKGFVGHTEASSGVVALVKVLAMMHGGYIPPQASYSRMSRLIPATDIIQVATSTQPWRVPKRKVALLNNYGASGSNVAMIVKENSARIPESSGPMAASGPITLPFAIAGRTKGSVRAYCVRLLGYLEGNTGSNLVDLSFHLHRQLNRSFPYRLVFGSDSADDLKRKLTQVGTANPSPEEDKAITAMQQDRPIILCFGGQVSKSIGLDEKLFSKTRILRHYLDECDTVIQSLEIESIYPDIFSQEPVQDQQHLQTMLFALQYSCAMSWMQSGLRNRVAAVVGHSFGELTAMCISGILSLRDTLKLVAGRAKLIRDLWGDDPGSMLAVEADLKMVQDLVSEASELDESSDSASIACYNGPQSFTLAGTRRSIAAVSNLVSQKYAGVRCKLLQVTNAFHSTLVNPLEHQLRVLGESITFNKPHLPLERTTETKASVERLGSHYVAEQMRMPVFFHHAVQRLARDHPGCVWLEAGSNSTVTTMAQRALDPNLRKSQSFQGIKINSPDAFSKLAEATVSLWKEGMPASFWPHNAMQTQDYGTMLLPPYQFEKDRHWVELKAPTELIDQIRKRIQSEDPFPRAGSTQDSNRRSIFTGYKNPTRKTQPRFQINTASQEFHDLITTHVLANTTGICSGMLQVDLAVDALFSLHPDWVAKGYRATLHSMTQQAPVCLNISRVLLVEFEDRGDGFWDWNMVSRPSEGAASQTTLHTTARLQIRDPKDAMYRAEFRRLGRFIDHGDCLSVLNLGPSHEDVEILQGRSVYQAFSRVVDFGEQYQSLRWLVGRGRQSAGRFARTSQNDSCFDKLRGEHISQVGGIWVNCMANTAPHDFVFVGAEIEMWMSSPDWADRPLPSQCDVLARHQLDERTGDYTTDSFVFDPVSGELVEVLLGVRFVKTPIPPFIRLLQRLTSEPPKKDGRPTIELIKADSDSVPNVAPPAAAMPLSSSAAPRRDLLQEMGEVVAKLVGVDVVEIGPDDNLVDFGIDSLLGMELQADIKKAFDCTPDENAIARATTLRDLVACIPFPENMGPALQDDARNGTQDKPTDSASQHSESFRDTPASEESQDIGIDRLSDGLWTASDVLESFSATKSLGDKMIMEHGLDNYDSVIIPESNRLCTALVVECFEELGCPLRTTQVGDILERIPFEPQHSILVNYIYNFLEKTAGLLTSEDNGRQFKRTDATIPTMNSQEITDELVDKYPLHADFLRLTHHACTYLARALKGETDGNRVLMSHPEGRRLCQAVYHNYVVNRIGFETMKNILEQLLARIDSSKDRGPLRILELGGGTGSATRVLLPLLASSGIPVEYTFTDLSSSLVAQARRTLGKQYPFMKFAVQDIEKPVVGEDLKGRQHIVLASHAVHATRSLEQSARNIRHALRPDGFLMVLEMREAWPALDLSFGLYEGWWLFQDGRSHVYTTPEFWKQSLTAAGYEAGGINWTDGDLPEHKYFMVVLGLASATLPNL